MASIPRGAALRRVGGGDEVLLPVGGILGRSSSKADIHLDDPRISSLHAELVAREDGLVLRALGGDLRVEGRSTAAIPLRVGLSFWLAPGVEFEVVRLEAALPEPATRRDGVRYCLGRGAVRASEPQLDGSVREVVVRGRPAAILAALLAEPGRHFGWQQIAARVWPEYGDLTRPSEVDRRRFRNLWDQDLGRLKRALAPLRGGGLLGQERGAGELWLTWREGDGVTEA